MNLVKKIALVLMMLGGLSNAVIANAGLKKKLMWGVVGVGVGIAAANSKKTDLKETEEHTPYIQNVNVKEENRFESVDLYNKEHIRRAENFWITERQVGETCIANTYHYMKAALTNNLTSIDYLNGDYVNDRDFYSVYNDVAKREGGEYFGGEWEIASKKIIGAIDDGKVVPIAINPSYLYEYVLKREGVKCSLFVNGCNTLKLGHAVIVIGLKRNKNNNVEMFYIADSSGPNYRKYEVSYKALKDAYSKNVIKTIISGIYIPKDRTVEQSVEKTGNLKIKEAIEYKPKQPENGELNDIDLE